MNTTRKILLSGSALAVAAIGNPALAQVGNIGPILPPVIGANNGSNTCIDGTTTGGYTVEHAPADTEHGASQPLPIGPDYTDQTLCTSFASSTTFNTSTGPNLILGEVDSTGEDDLLIVSATGSADATGNVSFEQTTHYDVTDPLNPLIVGVTQTSAPYGNSVAGNYTYSGTEETLQDTLYERTVSVSGMGTTGTGAESEYLVTTGNIWMEETTGTSSFDPVTGDVYYTPTEGQVTQLTIDGLSFTTLDPVNGDETITYGADGIVNGTSYVAVNPDSVVIHGGTTSTTVTVDNGGVHIADTTNGNTLLIDNFGRISNPGANNFGYVTVNDDLSVTGTLVAEGNAYINGTTFARGAIVNDLAGNGGAVLVDDDLTVSGNTALAGTLSVGGVSTFNGAVQANANVVVGDGIAASAGQPAIATGVTINATTQRISGVANGVISSTSTDVVTGQQLNATNVQVAANTTAITNLTATVNANYAQLMDRADKAYQGVAMGFAMNAAPLSLDNGEGGLAGGVGYFQGEWAGAIKAQYVTDSGVGVGINVGFSEDAVGGGVGASIKF